jgi:cobalt-zinc-cadmium efflux system membrane fusion protein
VQTVEDRPSVFVREKDGFAIKHVVLGGNAAGYVKVMGGLEGNEQVAVSNTYLLKAEHGKGEAGDDD